ncbi:MAG: hypothetical protein JXQ87_16640 [Bacteroidia bacterium]
MRSYFSGSISPYLTYESNYSRLLGQPVQFNGYGLGLEWESGVSLGLTFYRLGTNFITNEFSPNNANWQMSISYLSFMLAYELVSKEKFLIVAELGNGFGNTNFSSLNVQKSRYSLYSFEPTLHGRYYILNWLGLASQFGYRMSFPGGPATLVQLSSFKFDIGITIAPLALYEAYKNNEIID